MIFRLTEHCAARSCEWAEFERLDDDNVVMEFKKGWSVLFVDQ